MCDSGRRRDGFDASVAFVENLGPESLVHFTAPGLELADASARPHTDAGGDSTVGGLMVAQVSAGAATGITERSSVKLKLDRFSLFDVNNGSAL